MTNSTLVWQIINWASLPMLMLVLGIVLWRKLHKEYPFFFAYVVISVAAGLVRFAAQFFTPLTYFYAYWISDVVIAIFNILAVYELFVKRIFPRFYKVGLYRYLFPTLVAGAIFLAWFAAFAPRAMGVLALEDRVLDVIVVSVLMFFGFLMLIMGRRWTRYDFGIAFGFAIYAAAFLAASTLWTHIRYEVISRKLAVIAYDVGSLIWLCCFWSGERRAQGIQSQSVTPELLGEARAWQSMLKNWISSKKI